MHKMSVNKQTNYQYLSEKEINEGKSLFHKFWRNINKPVFEEIFEKNLMPNNNNIFIQNQFRLLLNLINNLRLNLASEKKLRQETENKIKIISKQLEKEQYQHQLQKKKQKYKEKRNNTRQYQSESKSSINKTDKDKVIIKMKQQFEAEKKLISYRLQNNIEELKFKIQKQEICFQNYKQENQYLRTELQKFRKMRKLLSTCEKQLTHLKVKLKHKDLQSQRRQNSHSNAAINSRMVSSFNFQDYLNGKQCKQFEQIPDMKFLKIESLNEKKKLIQINHFEENKKMKKDIEKYKGQIDILRTSQFQQSFKLESALSTTEMELEFLKKKIENMQFLHAQELHQLKKDHQKSLQKQKNQNKKIKIESVQSQHQIIKLNQIIKQKVLSSQNFIQKQSINWKQNQNIINTVIRKGQSNRYKMTNLNYQQQQSYKKFLVQNKRLQTQINELNHQLVNIKQQCMNEHNLKIQQQLQLRRLQITYQQTLASMKGRQQNFNEKYKKIQLAKQQIQSQLKTINKNYKQLQLQKQYQITRLQKQLDNNFSQIKAYEIEIEQLLKKLQQKQKMQSQQNKYIQEQKYQLQQYYKKIEIQKQQLEQQNIRKSQIIDNLQSKIKELIVFNTQQINSCRKQNTIELNLCHQIYRQKLIQSENNSIEMENKLRIELQKLQQQLNNLIEKQKRQRKVWNEVFNHANDYNINIEKCRSTYKNI